MRSVLAPLFIISFFAALPAWYLSTLEGWTVLDCVRLSPRTLLECHVFERRAFGSSSASYETLGAYAETSKQFVMGRHSAGHVVTLYQLVLQLPGGQQSVLRAPSPNQDVLQIAANLDAAARSDTAHFHAQIEPEPMFWLAAGLLLVFAGAGAWISYAGRPVSSSSLSVRSARSR
jgi:hypothetical protein